MWQYVPQAGGALYLRYPVLVTIIFFFVAIITSLGLFYLIFYYQANYGSNSSSRAPLDSIAVPIEQNSKPITLEPNGKPSPLTPLSQAKEVKVGKHAAEAPKKRQQTLAATIPQITDSHVPLPIIPSNPRPSSAQTGQPVSSSEPPSTKSSAPPSAGPVQPAPPVKFKFGPATDFNFSGNVILGGSERTLEMDKSERVQIKDNLIASDLMALAGHKEKSNNT